MEKEFLESLNAIAPAERPRSLRGFIMEFGPAIREQMRTTGRPLRDFVPLIRKALRREQDEPVGPEINFHSLEIYMSQFAPARAKPVKAEATPPRPAVVARLTIQPPTKDVGDQARAAEVPKQGSAVAATEDDRQRLANSLNAIPGEPE